MSNADLSSGESVLVTRANNDEDAMMKIISVRRINNKAQHSAFSRVINKTVSKSISKSDVSSLQKASSDKMNIKATLFSTRYLNTHCLPE